MGDERQPATAAATAAAAEPAAAAGPGPGPGHADLPAGGAAPAPEAVDVVFPLATEVAYHAAREAWFAALQRATLFVNVALGAGLLAAYIDARLAGFLVAITSAFDVTFDFAGQARRHRDLRGRFSALVEETADARCDQAGVRKAMLRLDADAPPSYRAVEAIAYNQALTGLGRDPDYRLFVPQHHRLLRHLWPFGGAEYESLKDRRERSAG